MAEEITVSMAVEVSKDGIKDSLSLIGLSVDMSGGDMTHKTQIVGTSQEQLVFGEITTPGWFLCINRDTTNYVELRAATGVADLVRLNAGEGCLFRLAADATAPFAIANAECVVEYLLIED